MVLDVQEVRREKMLVERLMKQCQQERRIATQLMHIRKEKDTIRNNRILRQRQYAEQRELEYHQTLDRQAVSGVCVWVGCRVWGVWVGCESLQAGMGCVGRLLVIAGYGVCG
jgi:hypothetical protein